MFPHHFLLITWLVTSVSAGTPVTPVSGRFGECVVLPCDGTASVGNSGDQIDILWRHESGDVLVFSHETVYPGPGFELRVNISKEGVSQGNFSVRLCSTTFSDERQYECYYRRKDSRVTRLGVVPLTVTENWSVNEEGVSSSPAGQVYRYNFAPESGANLSIPLHTADPAEVLFDPAGGGNWTSVCSVQNSTASCVPQYRDRVSVQNSSLTLRSLTPADQGNYTVRDLQGNTISTVTVTVTEEGWPLWKIVVPILLTKIIIKGHYILRLEEKV